MLDNIKEIVDLYLYNKSVGKDNIRKYTNTNATIRYEDIKMSKQARTLNSIEIRKTLDYVATRKHSERNRAMILLMYRTGIRVGECSSLRLRDVVDNEGNVRNEICLRAEQCKGNIARTVFISEKLKKDLQRYIKLYSPKDRNLKLFYSQKKNSDGFSPNSLTQYFHYLYQRVGLIGCSSHSTRRTFATTISEQGVSIRVIQKLLGHANIQTTARYCEATDNMLRRAVELV
jgi:integrase/recombinase XerD